MRKVVYHGGCFDGYVAKFVLQCYLGNKVTFTWRHGQPVPDLDVQPDDEIIFVDIAPPMDWPWKAQTRVLDHHKTAMWLIDDPSFLKVQFSLDKSGAGLALDLVEQEGAVVPPGLKHLVTYVEKGDLWRMNDHDKSMVAAIHSYPFTDEAMSTLVDRLSVREGRVALEQEGDAILRAKQKDIEVTLNNATTECVVDLRWMSYQVLVACTANHHSDVGNVLAQGRPFGVTYTIRGTTVFVSLRSTPEGEDVEAIAAHHGGGGHKHAAGFRMPVTEWFMRLHPVPGK